MARFKEKLRKAHSCSGYPCETVTSERIVKVKGLVNKPGIFIKKFSYIFAWWAEPTEKKARTTICDVILYYNNAAPHKTTVVTKYLYSECVNSPDYALCDFFLHPQIKEGCSGSCWSYSESELWEVDEIG